MNRQITNNFPIVLAKRKLKITKVARDTGISRTTLTKLYHSEDVRVSIRILEELCEYLNCPLSEILSDARQKEVI